MTFTSQVITVLPQKKPRTRLLYDGKLVIVVMAVTYIAR
jgi:hypothetical protein